MTVTGCDDDFLVAVTSVSTEEFFQPDDTGKDQSELGDDEGFTSQQSKTAKGERDQGTTKEKRDQQESLHLLFLSTFFAVERSLEISGSWQFDLSTKTK